MDNKLLLSLTVNPSEVTMVVNSEDMHWLQTSETRREALAEVLHRLVLTALQSGEAGRTSGSTVREEGLGGLP